MIGEYFVMQPLKEFHICRHNAVRETTAARERVLRLDGVCFRRPMGMTCHGHAVAIVRAPKAVPVGSPQVPVGSSHRGDHHRYGTPEKRDGGAQRSRTAQIIYKMIKRLYCNVRM